MKQGRANNDPALISPLEIVKPAIHQQTSGNNLFTKDVQIGLNLSRTSHDV